MVGTSYIDIFYVYLIYTFQILLIGIAFIYFYYNEYRDEQKTTNNVNH